jgi:lysophospholipase L1-like esterase
MTNLETVAAQRDEMSTKLRAMAQQLEAANAEIARLNAAPRVTNEFVVTEPDRRTAQQLATIAKIPVSAEAVNAAGILASDMPHTVVEKLRDAQLSIKQPNNADGTPFVPLKPKRKGLFGGKS